MDGRKSLLISVFARGSKTLKMKEIFKKLEHFIKNRIKRTSDDDN